MQKEKTNPDKNETGKKKKILLIGLGVAATGILGYFGWDYYRKRKKKKEDGEEDASSDIPQIPPQKSTFVPSFFTQQQNRTDDFPLKKGSKGAKVKAVQDSLIAKNGKGILPRYGADGDFGSEMVAALKKLGLPETIDESTYNVIAQAGTINLVELGKSLYKDAVNKNFNGVISSLKKMRSKDDYSAVSEEFKKYTLRGVRQTLVNGVLGSFSDEKQKQQIRLEFTRMGLKYDGSKWSLSGLSGFTIITTEPTLVWKTPSKGAKVSAQMVLGTEIASREGFTLFENNGKKFIVKTQTIKYL
ncbi:MAG: hypothetical protein HY841_00885 [Bacteroidetes bacterium]|nr:hypothetical protein [Bacteroidota bacterium]